VDENAVAREAVVPRAPRHRLAHLYEEHSASALRLAYLMTGDAQATEDLVQEAFARMFARFQDRKGPDAVAAYLRRSIVNLAHDRHRRSKTVRTFLAGARAPASSEEAAEVDARLVMRSRLQRIPHRQRAALVLRYYEDLSEAQTAEVLGCSVHAVKQLVQRGLRRMREQGLGDADE
jgi:RNA polymerase sigma-70 factor (sigma-E family)